MTIDPVASLTFLGILAAVYIPLERVFTRRKQRVLRPEFWTDFAYFLGQQLLFVSVTLLLLDAVGDALDATLIGPFRDAVAAQPLWLQAIQAVVLCDVCVYWGHRLSHRVRFLWRFHRVHHTSTHLDWMAAYREHPIDGLYTMLVENLPALILGFPLALIAGFIAFRGLWAIFIHSNVRLPLGPFKKLLGSPDLHHWHHDAEHGGNVNFANLSPLMDLLFGTYYDPKGKDPERYGTDEPAGEGYLQQLAWPLVETGRAALPEPKSTKQPKAEPLTH